MPSLAAGDRRASRLIALGLYVVPVIVAAAVLVVGHLWQLALALLAVEGTVAGLTALATRRSVAADARPGSGPDPGRRATGPGGGLGATAGPRSPWLVIGAMFGVVALLALLATLASRLG
jgi:hypothetical protein